ncbi:MAG: nuclear transport factor 2 family protein [Cytophagales bacterium]|nr:nuclear transport factor 2 family protein [Armatimonadota bacterium]
MATNLPVGTVHDSMGSESTERAVWAARFFQTIDAMDSPGFAAYFLPDGSFRMGNAPASVGRDAIETFVRGFFAALGGIGHQITGLWENQDTLLSEGVVTYQTHSGQTIELGYLGVMEFDGEWIREYRAYIDPAPLMAALQGAG